jgi:hypothetical protein
VHPLSLAAAAAAAAAASLADASSLPEITSSQSTHLHASPPIGMGSSSALAAMQPTSSNTYGSVPLSPSNPFITLLGHRQQPHGGTDSPVAEVTPVSVHHSVALSGLEMEKRMGLYRDMMKAASSMGSESREVEVRCLC